MGPRTGYRWTHWTWFHRGTVRAQGQQPPPMGSRQLRPGVFLLLAEAASCQHGLGSKPPTTGCGREPGHSVQSLCRPREQARGKKPALLFRTYFSFFSSPFNVKNLMTLQCPAEYTAAVGSDRLQSQRFWGSRYGQEWWLWAGVGWALLGDSGGSCGQQLPCPHPGSQRGAQLGEGKGWALLRKSRVLEEAPGPSYPCAHS